MDPDEAKIQVYCRLRKLKNNVSSCIQLTSSTAMCFIPSFEDITSEKHKTYHFEHIFCQESMQEEVFSKVALPLVSKFLNGKNGLLFTYGVTGSGKSYTLSGLPDNPGILFRTVDTIFNSISKKQTQRCLVKPDGQNNFEIQSSKNALRDHHNQSKDKSGSKFSGSDGKLYVNEGDLLENLPENFIYAVFVSFIEVYNNNVYDLLDDTSKNVLKAKVLRRDNQDNMYVHNVIEREVKSSAEMLDWFFLGKRRRRIASTALNSESSRSHSIFSIRLVTVAMSTETSSANIFNVTQLNLVDLAGSERANRTDCKGLRLQEASKINNSLMTLRNCLEILRDNQQNNTKKLVPYRENKLTFLFKNFFEGNGFVNMIVCMNPQISDYNENVHVAKFAQITKDVRINTANNNNKILLPTMLEKYDPIVINIEPLPDLPKDLNINQDNVEESLRMMVKLLRIRKESKNTHTIEMQKKERNFKSYLSQIESLISYRP